MYRSLLLSAFLVAGGSGCVSWHSLEHGSHDPVGELELRSAVGRAKRLDISNGIGDVRVEPSDDEVVHVHVRAFYRGGVAELGRNVASSDFVLELAGDTLTAQPAALGGGTGDEWKMDLQVRAPRRLEISVHGDVGECRVKGFSGPVSAETEVGKIEVQAPGLAGAVLKTGVGAVDLRVQEGPLSGDIHCETGVGEIRIQLPRGSPCRVSLDAGVGRVTSSGVSDVTVRESAPSASARGSASGGTVQVTADTGVGDIHLSAD